MDEYVKAINTLNEKYMSIEYRLSNETTNEGYSEVAVTLTQMCIRDRDDNEYSTMMLAEEYQEVIR